MSVNRGAEGFEMRMPTSEHHHSQDSARTHFLLKRMKSKNKWEHVGIFQFVTNSKLKVCTKSKKKKKEKKKKIPCDN
jgi:hypothetical protein